MRFNLSLQALILVFILVGCGQQDKSKSGDGGGQPSQPQSGNVQPVAPSPVPTTSSVPAQPPATLAASDQLPNLHNVNANLWRSGRPTLTGVAQLKAANIKTIISLETYMFDGDNGNGEENAAVQGGMKFIRIPLSGVTEPSVEDLNKAFAAIVDPANQPVLVHCRYGSDRTGMVVATYRIKQDKWTVEKAKAEMYQFGHSNLLSWWDSQLDNL